ncbi:unnamed protein product [Clonostachys rhizophaga]|uniref:Zn(2)-C6 fungal-type domain-containing protein n=1 Tax=Clonostachys rhizophaga TaxID=160324 RepID=A0A9N9VEJ2_9HYPO|nr:unnamed protein product [Clonostachys rhizophaga]
MQRITRMQAAQRAACTVCHQRKVKCDAHDVGLPCSNCTLAERSDCRLHQKRKRVSKATRAAATAAEPPTTPKALAPSLISDEAAKSPQSDRANPPSSPGSVDDTQRTSLSTPASVGVAGVDIHAAENGEYLYKRHLVEFIDQPELVERPIDSKARLTYIGSEVSNINFLVHQQFGARVRASGVCHYPTDRIGRHITSHNRVPLDAFQLPPKSLVDQLLTAYFRHANPGFPVVDERIFIRQYRARDPSNPPSLLLLQAILVVGAHVLYDSDHETRNSCKMIFFRRAKSLYDTGFERNRDTVVQAALLLTWHTDGVEDVTANAWFWLGAAVRTAMGLGMHRDADGSTLVVHNKHMWRRVWWLLFQSDVWVSLQYGRPQSIHLEDCTVQKLKMADFQDCGDDVRPEYMIQMSQLAVIVSEAVRARSRATTVESRISAVQKSDEKLASWALRLPHNLQLHTISGALDPCTANLHLHYNMALILLHRPLPQSKARAEHLGRLLDDNLEICVAAASSIQSLFQQLCEANNLRSLWISVINCLFTALIQLSSEIRLSNPLLAVSALRRYDSALISLKQLSRHWPNAESVLHFFEKSIRVNSVEAIPANRPDNNPLFISSSNQDLRPSEKGKESDLDNSNEEHLHDTMQNKSPCLVQPLPVADERGFSQDIFGATEEIHDAWGQWQSENWSTPEFSDDYLFTF